MRHLAACLVALWLAMGAASLFAAPTTEAQARAAVARWIAADMSPMNAAIGSRVLKLDAVKGSDGLPLYFIAAMTTDGTSASGFVILSGDDQVEPIIAFSSGQHFERGKNTPMNALLDGHLPAHIDAARKKRLTPKSATRAKRKWDALLNTSQTETSAQTVSDLRVAPLVSTLWDQLGLSNQGCYNYFTPPYAAGSDQNYPSGCVATALGQLMRFYQYPTGRVGTPSFAIQIGGTTTIRSLRGSDGWGSAYSWAEMILKPTAAITTAQRQAIGALLYDAGISVSMQYDSIAHGGSGADTLAVKDSLVNVFAYSNAVKGYNHAADLGAGLPGMINPNLDAGLPVLLGISGAPGGHAVLCDGYGYNLNTLYHHLNMGWSGLSNVWYALPTIDSAGGTYTSVYKCVYNVYPSGSGEIISGRITDNTGRPVQGASILAVCSTGGNYLATSGSNGIYAFAKIPAASNYTLSASKPGYASASRTVVTGRSVDYASLSGNVANADIALAAQNYYTLGVSVYPSAGGIASGGGDLIEGSSASISAVPNEGWIFTGWNDGNMQNPRTVIVPPVNLTYTAYFTAANSARLSTSGSGTATFPATFSWTLQGLAPALKFLVATTPDATHCAVEPIGGTLLESALTLGVDRWKRILGVIGSSSTYYWNVGVVDSAGRPIPLGDWSAFTANIPKWAEMISPANGATLDSTKVTFSWSAGLEATEYALWVGSTPGSFNWYAGAEGTALSRTLSLPTGGKTLYVTLWSRIGATWKWNAYTYTSYADPAAPRTWWESPLPGTVLTSSTVTLKWNSTSPSPQFGLWIGNTLGAYDLYAGAEGTVLSKTVSLPEDGRPIYARLWSLRNGVYDFDDTWFTAKSAPELTGSELTSPAKGSELSSPVTTFVWNRSATEAQCVLWVGNSPGAYDLHASWEVSGFSKTVSLPSDGRPLYVRLWSLVNGKWLFKNYTFTAFDSAPKLISPAPGSALPSASATFQWNAGIGVSEYALWVGSAPAAYDLSASLEGSNLSKTLTLPSDGRALYVRLWSKINGSYNYKDFTYTAADFKARMLTPATGSRLTQKNTTFVWEPGKSASGYGLWIGSTPQSYDVFFANAGTALSQTAPLPTDGRTLYVTLWTLVDGAWHSSVTTYVAPSSPKP